MSEENLYSFSINNLSIYEFNKSNTSPNRDVKYRGKLLFNLVDVMQLDANFGVEQVSSDIGGNRSYTSFLAQGNATGEVSLTSNSIPTEILPTLFGSSLGESTMSSATVVEAPINPITSNSLATALTPAVASGATDKLDFENQTLVVRAISSTVVEVYGANQDTPLVTHTLVANTPFTVGGVTFTVGASLSGIVSGNEVHYICKKASERFVFDVIDTPRNRGKLVYLEAQGVETNEGTQHQIIIPKILLTPNNFVFDNKVVQKLTLSGQKISRCPDGCIARLITLNDITQP